ncbi:SRPBCC family protein [Candidatus Nitrosocosmicus sp. R]
MSDIGSFASPKDKYLYKYIVYMTKFEITNENVEQSFSSNMRRNNKTLNAESKGTITIEETHGAVKFERRLSNPKEAVWKAITDPKEIFRWLPDYKGTFDGYNGGAIDLVNTYQDHT